MSDATTRVQIRGTWPRLFRQKFSLQVVAGPDRGRSLVTAAESTTVGSAPWNDLQLTDPAVSRHHLRIKIGPDGFLLTDLDSTNGTEVANLHVRQAILRGTTNFKVGDTTIRFTPLADEEEIPLVDADRFGAAVGRSATMRELFRKLERISAQEMTVLIEGETGTGKEIIAREIHRHSRRAASPFIIVDCGALPPSLVEAELFGWVAGAFTDASAAKDGPFEAAAGGTIFLDEVGELDVQVQPKLLRVLERKELKRVGENRHRTVDVRIIAATSRDLSRALNQGTFRADLYYRMAVAHVTVPPLRHRLDDIPLLVGELWPQIGGGGSPPQLPLEKLKQHLWPGNVRELRNALERMVVFAETDEPVDPELALGLDEGSGQLSVGTLDALPYRQAKVLFERQYLRRILERHDYNVAAAAKQSGIDRVHLYRLIRKHDLQRGDP